MQHPHSHMIIIWLLHFSSPALWHILLLYHHHPHCHYPQLTFSLLPPPAGPGCRSWARVQPWDIHSKCSRMGRALSAEGSFPGPTGEEAAGWQREELSIVRVHRRGVAPQMKVETVQEVLFRVAAEMEEVEGQELQSTCQKCPGRKGLWASVH